jgi:hypothetical protein
MASREGTVVLFDDLVKEATQRVFAIVEEKNPELSEEVKDEIAEAVALGALKYTMLSGIIPRWSLLIGMPRWILMGKQHRISNMRMSGWEYPAKSWRTPACRCRFSG